MVAEILIVGTEGNGIVQLVRLCCYDKGIVSFVATQFLDDVLEGNTDAQTDSLTLMTDGVLGADRPVGTPAATCRTQVTELLGTLDVDEPCSKLIACGRTVETDIDLAVATIGIERVAGGHGEGRGGEW